MDDPDSLGDRCGAGDLCPCRAGRLVVATPFRHEDRRDRVCRGTGHRLTIDVLKPRNANGAGVLALISGKWQSRRDPLQDVIVAPLLRRGYTVIAVTHGSQPEFTVMEIVADLQYAVRFIRHHADEYGIAPNRFGVVGGSSGGHLAMMLATGSDAGDPPPPTIRLPAKAVPFRRSRSSIHPRTF